MKNRKGVTLIALVMTIILSLIILAISLNIFVGNQGIVSKAIVSRQTANLEEAKDKLRNIVTEYSIRNFEKNQKHITKEELLNAKEMTDSFTINDYDLIYKKNGTKLNKSLVDELLTEQIRIIEGEYQKAISPDNNPYVPSPTIPDKNSFEIRITANQNAIIRFSRNNKLASQYKGSKININFGDGTEAELNYVSKTDKIEHVYTKPGEYLIEIKDEKGDFPFTIDTNTNAPSIEKAEILKFGQTNRKNYDDFINEVYNLDISDKIQSNKVTSINRFMKICILNNVNPDLFANLVDLETTFELFYGVGWMKGIPENLFANNLKLKSMKKAFFLNGGQYYKRKRVPLDTVPEGLFKNNTKLENLELAFASTKIKLLPAGLFRNNLQLKSIFRIFENCDNLVEIPENLFSENHNLEDISCAFLECYGLKKIPVKIFSPKINRPGKKLDKFEVFHLFGSTYKKNLVERLPLIPELKSDAALLFGARENALNAAEVRRYYGPRVFEHTKLH